MNTILRQNKLLRYGCLAIFCQVNLIIFLLSPMAMAQPVLQLSSTNVPQGGVATLGLSISDITGETYGGINADIILPSCITPLGVYPSESLSDNFFVHSVPFSKLGVNGIKLIVYSATESFTNNTTLANIVIQVADNCSTQIYPITFAGSNSDESINIKHAIASPGSVSVSHSIADATLTVTAYTPDLDSDNDGMDDDWELLFFGDLSHDGTADSDADGYTDLQEFLNYTQGLTDSSGNIFDPAAFNAAYSPGYNASSASPPPPAGSASGSSFWLMMMPAILISTEE